MGHQAAVEVKGAKKRVLSAAGRAAIAKAAKKRWAKIKKEAKKTVRSRLVTDLVVFPGRKR